MMTPDLTMVELEACRSLASYMQQDPAAPEWVRPLLAAIGEGAPLPFGSREGTGETPREEASWKLAHALID